MCQAEDRVQCGKEPVRMCQKSNCEGWLSLQWSTGKIWLNHWWIWEQTLWRVDSKNPSYPNPLAVCHQVLPTKRWPQANLRASFSLFPLYIWNWLYQWCSSIFLSNWTLNLRKLNCLRQLKWRSVDSSNSTVVRWGTSLKTTGMRSLLKNLPNSSFVSLIATICLFLFKAMIQFLAASTQYSY